MKILLTGATGFIGQHLCRRLAEDGHTVLALLRSPGKAASLPRHNVEFLEGDLSLFKNPGLKLPPCDVVIHLAAALIVKTQQDYFTYNYQPVVDMAECLKRQAWAPRRFILASSLAAGGPCRCGRPLDEEDPSCPVCAYGKSKVKAEEYLRTAPFPSTSFRPGMVFGPGDPAALTLFKIADKGLAFKITGLNQKLSFIYITDLVDAIVRMAHDTGSAHKLYYVVHDQQITTTMLWDTIGKALGKKLFMIRIPKQVLRGVVDVLAAASRFVEFENRLDRKKFNQMTEPAFLCSSARLKQELDWQPQCDFDTAMRATAAGYRDAGWV